MQELKCTKKCARNWTPKRLKSIYIIARRRERKTRDLCTMRCVKDENQKVLIRDEKIKKRWREYFDRLFNGSSTQDLGDRTIQCQDMNVILCS